MQKAAMAIMAQEQPNLESRPQICIDLLSALTGDARQCIQSELIANKASHAQYRLRRLRHALNFGEHQLDNIVGELTRHDSCQIPSPGGLFLIEHDHPVLIEERKELKAEEWIAL